jgi:hypothetical protein
MHQVGHIDPLKADPERTMGRNIPDVIDRNPILLQKNPTSQFRVLSPKKQHVAVHCFISRLLI